MLIDLLFSGQVAAYLRDGALGRDPCVFVHVPKTAGTSLRTELATILQPDVNIVVDYEDESRSFHQRIDDAVAMFLADAQSRQIRFASGHILARHVTRIRNVLPDSRFVTFLRRPLDRIISDYRYQRSPKHPVHADFIARVPSLDAYLEIRAEQNKMAQHLVPADILLAGDEQECIDYVMRTYAFVGIQEMYPISVRTLTALLGQPMWPKVRENVNTENDAEGLVTPEVTRKVREMNRLDSALYDHFSAGLAGVRDALARQLGGA